MRESLHAMDAPRTEILEIARFFQETKEGMVWADKRVHELVCHMFLSRRCFLSFQEFPSRRLLAWRFLHCRSRCLDVFV